MANHLRCLYDNSFAGFLSETEMSVLGRLVDHYNGEARTTTIEAWKSEIAIMQDTLSRFGKCEGRVIFEYDIPRLGKRIDVVLLFKGIIFCIEFKVGETHILEADVDQVLDYALETLHSLGVEILVQCGIEKEYHQAGWEHKWELWQRFYTMAHYVHRKGAVKMMALCNEPNHRNAGPMPLSSWLAMAEVARDAMHQAVPGSEFVGPVTAGVNTDWWEEVAASDMVDLFSTHSYNLPANGYRGRVRTATSPFSSMSTTATLF